MIFSTVFISEREWPLSKTA